jgi:hypothetical protein
LARFTEGASAARCAESTPASRALRKPKQESLLQSWKPSSGGSPLEQPAACDPLPL